MKISFGAPNILRRGIYAAGLVALSAVSLMSFSTIAEAANPIQARPDFGGYYSKLIFGGTALCAYSQRGANNCLGAGNKENFVLPPADGTPDGLGSLALPCNAGPPVFNPATGNYNITNVSTFILMLQTYNVSGDIRKVASSAFIIHTLLGRTGDQANSAGGRTISAADWIDVTARLNAATIDWSCSRGATGRFRTFSGYLSGTNQADVVYYDSVTNPQIGVAIVITSGASTYTLFRECANPSGESQGLPPAAFGITLTASSNPVAVPPPAPAVGPNRAPVQAGQAIDISATLQNAGPADSIPGVLQVMFPVGFATAPCPSACPTGPPGQSTFSGYSSAQGFRSASAIPGAIGTKNWFWNINPVPSGLFFPSGTVNFVVPPTALPGAQFTVDVYYYPADLAGGVQHVALLFRVVSKRVPGIAALNGDVHAGGCGLPPGVGGRVISDPTGTSYGQYVVSSTSAGPISNFKSDNSSPGNTLRLGRSGNYSQLCRKDLLTAAIDGRPAPGQAQLISTNTWDVTGKQGVWYYEGHELQISGTVNQLLTIVATIGDVRFAGNTTLDTANYLGHSAPSLGVIAAGNILIDPPVTKVDAYLFANGTINTCDSLVVVLGCSVPNVLTVRGFLMAGNIIFGRLGDFNTNGAVNSEIVVLNPQIYLNPPKYFDGSVDETLLLGQGERAPRF